MRRGDVLTAQVEGSEFAPYVVTVRLREGGVAHTRGVTETRCSCPYDWGGACKHVVAVLLKFVAKPGEVVERLPLADMLRDLDRAALAALLISRRGGSGLGALARGGTGRRRAGRIFGGCAPHRRRSETDQTAG
ncbi:SWIM zinc finger family protein [Mesorhizobium sp. M0106]|uniref:SWIM zinc finger family protein n=1 Tax=Mesorhizobium sp. M0106 TaxID=2956880 RepID=UPI003338C0B7